MTADEPVRIDRAACTCCGVCVSVCPDRILQGDAAGKPVVTADSCMRCGHCHAACPAAAVEVVGMGSRLRLRTIETPDGDTTREIKVPELLQLMERRRSCRLFKSEPVADDLLVDLMRIGVTAPSGTNSQGLQFIIVPERAEVVRLGEAVARFYRGLNRKAANPLLRLAARLIYGDALGRYYRRYYVTVANALRDWEEQQGDRLFHGAPAALVVAADDRSSCPAEDALLATQNILLAAQAVGLGTCLIGFAVEAAKRDKAIPALLGLKSDERIYSVIACGYPAVTFFRPTGRKEVRPRFAGRDVAPNPSSGAGCA